MSKPEIAVSNELSEELKAAAKKFYGDAFSRSKEPEKLFMAYHRLMKAIEYEAEGGKDRMVNMSLTLALKNETEAFGGVAESTAKAA